MKGSLLSLMKVLMSLKGDLRRFVHHCWGIKLKRVMEGDQVVPPFTEFVLFYQVWWKHEVNE